MWKIVVVAVTALVSTTSELGSQNTPNCALPSLDPEYGSYGYMHHELHRHGVIDKLIRQSGKTCCDGGLGGECRVTTIMHCGTQPMAWLDGTWCPINANVVIFKDIALPEGAFAVVCAAKRNIFVRCPNNYCAAQAPGL